MVSEKMQGSARASRSRCVMNTTEEMSSQEETMIKYVCGIDLGSQSCAGCITRPDKSVVVKPLTFTNAKAGGPGLGKETESIGCSSQPDPHRDGSHLSLWRKAISR